MKILRMLKGITDASAAAGRHPFWTVVVLIPLVLIGLGGALLTLTLVVSCTSEPCGIGVFAVMGALLLRSGVAYFAVAVFLIALVPAITLYLCYLVTNFLNGKAATKQHAIDVE
jgi:hypothetical protein